MFSTLKLDSGQKAPQLMRSANAASVVDTGNYILPRVACDMCRVRKVRYYESSYSPISTNLFAGQSLNAATRQQVASVASP
jgi:hypothetical protein